MLQEVKEITPTTKKLRISIPQEVIEQEFVRAYDKLRASVKIPGFRAGKAPQAILEKKFAKDIEAQVMEKVVPEFYSNAIKEAGVSPVAYPSIDEKIEIVRSRPLSFTITVEVKPEMKNLSYEGIKLKEAVFSVEETEVDAAINAVQEDRALFKVSEDAISDGDMAIIDCDAFIDGVSVNELSVKDYPFVVHTAHVVKDEDEEINKKLNDALSGKKKGDAVDLKVHFNASHPNKTIAGKEVLLKAVITEVKKKFVPEMDDEFIKSFGCGDMDELKKKVHDDLFKKKKNQADMIYKKELLNALISSNDFEAPSSMVENELEALVQNAKQNAGQKGETPKGDDELRQAFKQTARDNVKGVLILEAIGNKEKIEVMEEDQNRYINELAVIYKIQPEEVKKLFFAKDGSLDGMKSRLGAEKVLDFVLEKAVIAP
ncbi:MAG: trigger factor [Nitrospirae bacterium]|nr:trigger factor [Nitrospirota bacterium]